MASEGHRRVAVLGGGAAGVVAARRLAASADCQVDLLEASPTLGGLHRSAVFDRRAYDVGAFVFGPAHHLLQTFPELAPQFVPVAARYRRITPTRQLDVYPISIDGYIREYGARNAVAALADLWLGKRRHRHANDVAAFACFRMGRRIYESSGLKAYIERLYGMPDREVGLEFAKQRLRHLEQITLASATRQFMRRMLRSPTRADCTPVLVRPPHGFTPFYASVRALIEREGVEVIAPVELKGISRPDRHGFEIRAQSITRRYDAVISTIPLHDLLRLLDMAPSCVYPHVRLVTLFYRGRLRREGEFIYNFSLEGRWKRISVFSRLYGECDASDRFSVEIATTEERPADVDELRRDFERHASRYAIASELEWLGHEVTERAYPVFRHGQSELVDRDRARVESLGITLAGRQGTFAYLTSDEAARQGTASALGVATALTGAR